MAPFAGSIEKSPLSYLQRTGSDFVSRKSTNGNKISNLKNCQPTNDDLKADNIKRVMQKRKIAVAKEWLNKKDLSSGAATAVTFYSLMIAYGQFCQERREEPLEGHEFLILLQHEVGQIKLQVVPNSQQAIDSGCESSDQESECILEKKPEGIVKKEKQFSFKSEILKRCLSSDSSAYDSGLEGSDDQESDSQSDCNMEIQTVQSVTVKPAVDGNVLKKECGSPKQKITKIDILNLKQEPQDASEVIQKDEKILIIDEVASILSLKNFLGCQCYESANKLVQVLLNLMKQGQLKNFLMTFSHSMSCGAKNCTNLCFMFKRIFSHMATPNHKCAVKNVYGHVLKLHIDTCRQKNCGLPNCNELKNIRKKALEKNHNKV